MYGINIYIYMDNSCTIILASHVPYGISALASIYRNQSMYVRHPSCMIKHPLPPCPTEHSDYVLAKHMKHSSMSECRKRPIRQYRSWPPTFLYSWNCHRIGDFDHGRFFACEICVYRYSFVRVAGVHCFR